MLAAYCCILRQLILIWRMCVCVRPQQLSCVWLFTTPWTIACQVPLSMEFSRQEYWIGLPFPTPVDLPDPGIEPMPPALAGRFFTTVSHEKPSVQNMFSHKLSKTFMILFIKDTHTLEVKKVDTQTCTHYTQNLAHATACCRSFTHGNSFLPQSYKINTF